MCVHLSESVYSCMSVHVCVLGRGFLQGRDLRWSGGTERRGRPQSSEFWYHLKLLMAGTLE